MDGERFDNLLRWLAGNVSRRAITRSMAAVAMGTPLATWLSPVETEARKRRKKKKKKCKGCSICQQCKKGKCKPKPEGTDCGGGKACQAGACLCPLGQKDCDGACIPENQCCPSDCDDGSSCTTDVCNEGTCIHTPLENNSPCDGDGRCLDGVCNPVPTCSARYGPCTTVDDCCSAGSTQVPTTCPTEGPEAHTCRGRSDTGQPCHDGTHCWPGANCVGYVCI